MTNKGLNHTHLTEMLAEREGISWEEKETLVSL